MYPIDLTGKKGVVLGVANDRSIAWSIARILGQAGARLALTYQGDRLKDRVTRLAGTLEDALVIPCDATDDDQIEAVFTKVKEEFGDLSFLVHSIAYANRGFHLHQISYTQAWIYKCECHDHCLC